MEALEYDRYGRLKYNPIFHSKHKTPWSTEDLQYLINFYDFAGPEEMSFALERPATAIKQKVNELRKKGVMKKSQKIIRHEKINPGTRKKSCANSST